MGRNASANSIGVVNRIEAPQSDNSSAVRMTTDGIEMIIVVVWKNALMVVPIPVMNIWCAHTMNDMNPMNTTVDNRARYPHKGLSVLLAITSESMPIAGMN